MDDPIRRIQRVAASQGARQDQNGAAGDEWAKMLPALIGYVRKVSLPLKSKHDLVVAVSPEGLIVQFGKRIAGINAGGAFALEEGPQAKIIFSKAEGRVHGYRKPAHLPNQNPEFREYVSLGEPAGVTQEAIGHAVADFLEWGAVGDGRSPFATPLE
jgi:hypothetical protein